jgi:hypothetical protein
MRPPLEPQATVTAETVKIQDQRLILQAQIGLELPLPEQDADLPRCLEAGIERGGQILKRRLFQQAVERADAELILARRQGKHGLGIRCRGTAPFTFKTVFGTVRVRRRRIEHQADGTTEVPSAHAWQTPRQVAIMPGLRAAVCEGLLRDSAQQVVTRIDGRAGESGVLAKTTVLEVVHDEGLHLRAAAHTRAEAIYARDPEALQVFVPAIPQQGAIVELEDPHDGEDETEAADPAALIGFPGGPTDPPEVKRDHPRKLDEGVVLVELDEVKVHAQAHTGRKQVLALTALVMIAGHRWHLAAATTPELAYQVGALLAVLGVHRGARRLLVLADGARWIRDWFEGLSLSSATMIVCWWHLVKRCGQDLSRACRGREHRREVESAALQALWHGRVDEALEVLRAHAGQMKNDEALEDLIGYLEARRPYLPDYATRQRAGLWIASNRVEKFNDWSVSARCKHRGMEWTEAGVVALAVLEATRRNGELPTWRAKRRLPAWKAPRGRKKVA